MKIYTKTGDLGQTSLLGGTRVSKSCARIDTYGTVDELNSYIGLLADFEINQNRITELREIQDRLFTIGSSLAAESENNNFRIPDLKEEDITFLENKIDSMNESLPALKSFILPGGHQAVSFSHVARCVCRRAERLVIQLAENEFVASLIIKYLNRLSDYLFVIGRKICQELEVAEINWKPRV
jgi:cob(I)alamin adenosyltransferase